MQKEIVWRHPDELTPYNKNPRKNTKAVKRVADSIREFGFNQPIVVDKNDVIVVGHTRWKASKELELTEVPVLAMPDGISDEKVRAYRIADNKLNELAGWDERTHR
jgi:ParB/RepB/Spo0J family partition protein